MERSWKKWDFIKPAQIQNTLSQMPRPLPSLLRVLNRSFVHFSVGEHEADVATKLLVSSVWRSSFQNLHILTRYSDLSHADKTLNLKDNDHTLEKIQRMKNKSQRIIEQQCSLLQNKDEEVQITPSCLWGCSLSPAGSPRMIGWTHWISAWRELLCLGLSSDWSRLIMWSSGQRAAPK